MYLSTDYTYINGAVCFLPIFFLSVSVCDSRCCCCCCCWRRSLGRSRNRCEDKMK